MEAVTSIRNNSLLLRHVFCCTNERPADSARGSCARRDGKRLRDYMKARFREMREAGELGRKRIRINSAGCLDRCELGPTMVIYPDEVWYRCQTESDIDEILTSHVRDGQPVARLALAVDA